MAGDATQGVGVFVVDLAPQRIAAGRCYFGRCDAVAERIRWPEHCLVHPQRLKHPAVEELVERLTGDDFHQQTKDVSPQVRIDVLGARTAFERRAQDQRPGLERGLGNAPYVASSRQS